MTSDPTDAGLHTMTGAYALNALSEPERRAFEAHLAQCASCAQEVAELAETAARLGAAAQVQPPPQLRERVLSAAARTRQLPPEVPRHVPTRRGGRWLRRATALTAAAGVLVAVGLGVQAVRHGRQLEREVDALRQTTAEYGRFADLLAAPDAKLVRGPVNGGGTGTAVVSHSRGAALFLAEGLTALPEDRSYQLWVIGRDGPRPAGVLDSATNPQPLLAEGVSGADRFGLTVEPRGGSPKPTTGTVVVLALA
ncbi:anti-sigma factor domain-containing protein [Actinosynnema sp. NPDC053489]|uniref:anti-sigma factor n=1 Tax=Actinosynnema sp. NPDC053489 TaxID=3363916 RepID=UPI0037CBA803